MRVLSSVTAARELWCYRSLIENLIRRELKLKYRGSLLGWFWSLIHPAVLLAVYAVIFGLFLRLEPPASVNGEVKNYAMFLFAGLVVWNFFHVVVTRSMNWLLDMGALLNKAYFPAESPIVAGGVVTLVQLGIELFVLIGVLLMIGEGAAIMLLMIPIVLLLVLMVYGIALVLSIANVYYRDIAHLVSVGMTVWFYATPVVYPLEIVPRALWGWFPAYQVIRLNPLTQFVEASRDVLYHLQLPSAEQIAYLLVVPVGLFLLGVGVFRRRSPYLSEEL